MVPAKLVQTATEAQKLRLLAAYAIAGQAHPAVVDAALTLIKPVRHDPIRRARRLHAFVRDHVAYVDEHRAERFQKAHYTLAKMGGDCDCQAILMGALAGAAGLRWRAHGYYVPGEPIRHAWISILGYHAETTVPAWFGEDPWSAARRTAPTRRDILAP